MADVPPPAYEPPMAEDAPDMLVSFLYILARDFVPFGVIESALHRARTDSSLPTPGWPAAFATDVARELVYDGTSVRA